MQDVAVVGMGCRFPGAAGVEAFWRLLQRGLDAVTEVPPGRWDVSAYYDPRPATPAKMYTRWGAFLEEVDQFEPAFFGISPREAQLMDPQQRLLLEVAWEALEDAGLAAERLSGSRTGVFVGISNSDYARLLYRDLYDITAYSATGTCLSVAANRVSYVFNFRGPSLAIDTACSSSLVSVHLACAALCRGEADLCLAGGVNLILCPEGTIIFSQARMMAADGRCKTFDDRADGYVRGEGCGLVVLKRLADALRDGDRVLAVIRGSAVNQDGLTNGLTAPNGPSQIQVIRDALEDAGVRPSEIGYVEAHGTGTSLGDPIELKALRAVLTDGRGADEPCWLGSVKTNVGHLESAAGIISLMKVVLALWHRKIPPHLHFTKLNRYISLDGTPLRITTECLDWPAAGRRLAGVSAFGFGGTNCHIIVAEPPQQQSPQQQSLPPQSVPPQDAVERPRHLLTLRAKTPEALRDLAAGFARHLQEHPDVSLPDLCYTANTGRCAFRHRLAVQSESAAELRERLCELAARPMEALAVAGSAKAGAPKIAFLFTGQGSQYVGMGRQLYESQPTFRQALDRCAQILEPHLERPLLEVLYPSSGESSPINETAYTQPALFSLEYALAELWASWGIEPALAAGHSVGEYVAACRAGIFSLEDGLWLTAARARLMQELPHEGQMVAVLAEEPRVAAAIEPLRAEVSIAAINDPRQVVISGCRGAVQAVVAQLRAEGVRTKELTVSHAFHSPLMAPILGRYGELLAAVKFSAPRFGIVSNLSGRLAEGELSTPDYWQRHVLAAVRFRDSIAALLEQGCDVLLEIGPKPILLGLGRACVAESKQLWLPSLREGRDDWSVMLAALGALFVRGAHVDWRGFDRDYPRRKVSLPTYPFQRRRYWVPPRQDAAAQPAGEPADSRPVATATAPAEKMGTGSEPVREDNGKTASREVCGELSRAVPVPIFSQLPAPATPPAAAKAEQGILHDVKDWLYEVQWQPKQRAGRGLMHVVDQPGGWLIFADRGGVGAKLAEKFAQCGQPAVLVEAGESFGALAADRFSINPREPGQINRLLDEIFAADHPACRGIVHLWSLDACLPQQAGESLAEGQVLACGSALHLAQALTKREGRESPRLWLVTRGGQAVCGGATNPLQSAVWGLGRVISLELPRLRCVWLDLDPATQRGAGCQPAGNAANWQPARNAADRQSAPHAHVALFLGRAVDALFEEIADPDREDQVAFRGAARYVARLVPHSGDLAQGPAAIEIRSDGTYLITGGLGALGLETAKWLTAQGARHLVLLGRRAASPAASEALQQLEQSGVAVRTLRCDAAQHGELAAVLGQVRESMPPLRGVVHAAGVLDDGVLIQQNWDRFWRVMAAKIDGAWNLHLLTRDMPLDFFVCFSSVAGVLGSPGQANYAAANAFLQGFAHFRRENGLPALSIHWGPWASAGMAAGVQSQNQARWASAGLSTIPITQGMAVLGKLLREDAVDVGVLPVDWSKFLQQFPRGRQPTLLDQQFRQAVGSQPRPGAEAPSVFLQNLRAATPERRTAMINDFVHGHVAQTLGTRANQVDADEPLRSLGFDSLMAVELKTRLEAALGIEVLVESFSEEITVHSLAAAVEREIEVQGSEAADGSGGLEVVEQESPLPVGSGCPTC